MHAGGRLTNLLASRLGLEKCHFLRARVSHAEFDGESDLVVAFGADDLQVIAHVENKIAAEFQPKQVQRYIARGQRWAAMDGVARSVTVLLAPGDYMNRPGAEGFELRITYEEASAALCADGDPRAVFLADALAAGVETYRRGYVMTPDEAVSALLQRCWLIASRMTPDLNFAQPGLKPRGGTWPWFPDAKGFSKDDTKWATSIYKMERGQADLQFSKTSVEDLNRRCLGILDGDMTVERASKSASIRISVPPVDFSDTAEDQEAALAEGLAACERLRVVFVTYRTRLLLAQE